MTRQRVYLAITAVTGIALFGWTVVSVGPHELVAQLRALAPVLPLLLALAGVRFLLQAAGWRLAIAPDQRPSWTDMFAAVVAGEAAGYFAWGTVSRTSPDLRGPRDNNVDFSLFKSFRIRETLRTELRAEAFNFFNHPIWNGPGTNVSAPGTVGVIQSKGGQRRVRQLVRRSVANPEGWAIWDRLVGACPIT